MRKLCPNFDREDGLDTVLEVPIPEEMFPSHKSTSLSWQNVKSWMKSNPERSATSIFGGRNKEIQLLLGVVGAPLIPLSVRCDRHPINQSIKDHPIVSQTPLDSLSLIAFIGFAFFLKPIIFIRRRLQWRNI